MQKEFNKYQGAGNDFIIFNNIDSGFPADNHKLISNLCDRHFGIGADGLILLNHSRDYDFEMQYFNSDGKPGSMCGNGGRCITSFALDQGLANGRITFMASDGLHSAEMAENKLISLSMKDVPGPVMISGNHFLNTGSPHYIIPVPGVDKIDVAERGRAIRWAKQFAPEGTNVNFVETLEDRIRIRTYERGVEDETLSCGTGVTASAISSRWGKSRGENRIFVETRGGNLEVCFHLNDKKAENVYLKGPAQKVFSGIINLDKYKN